MRPLFGETPRVGFADTMGRAGDDGNFVFESHGASVDRDCPCGTRARVLSSRDADMLNEAWCFACEEGVELARRESQPDEESPEQPIHRAGFVEAHLVDQFFKYQRIVGEKIDAPFPVVEPMEPEMICVTRPA